MKVKKYVAPSMQEAMKKIRAEMGNDAVILNSKSIQTGGFLGLFTKKKIEVIAAMDPDTQVGQQPKKETKAFVQENTVSQTKFNSELANQNTPKPVEKVADHKPLLDEINELKRLVQTISSDEKMELYPEPLQLLLQKMIKQDISSSLRTQIMGELLEYWYNEKGNVTVEQLIKKQQELFASRISNLEFGGISYKKKYINVIGPTGVGKTTTLAKLAAECVLQKKKKVAFITTDTYRIAAIEQLKTYAKILDVPMEVCYTIEDFKEAKKKLSMYDYVFIDTAGRNFLEEKYVSDLEKIIDFNEEMETYLVLAATAKSSDMLAVYEQFSVIPISKLIFTKLDETATRGTLFDVMIKTKKGIAYTTHGQDVPDDIEAATRERIVEQMLR
ncbi:flagellar biosynthesis protein FlhF [Metabacillus litoralis]|uniref:flagellar biosynthesis protein FlhF n=1 Tax=Metabacillus litoralis TaxID=152268 RepID=UPI002041842B|nr:flagellar biosynthesis protein FlhF [Metabacillus litoralis]MCM3409104.1 flagellar biosynthesis protein FlhF [Metabacillus litoralis]